MEDKPYPKCLQLAGRDDRIRAAILTSSRVDPDAVVDTLSDYDIELYVSNFDQFADDKWFEMLGPVLIKWPLKPKSTFRDNGITRLVLFESGTRIDFQIYPALVISPSTYDCGYKILIDKDNLALDLSEPTYSSYLIQKPTEDEYLELVNDFFWDSTYVIKNLKRDELYYAKFMLDNVIRFNMLQKMIEWYIAVTHGWSVKPNKFGRLFKRYLDTETWVELEATFSGPDIEDNYCALKALFKLFRRLAKEVAENLDYKYPDDLDQEVTKYCDQVRLMDLDG